MITTKSLRGAYWSALKIREQVMQGQLSGHEAAEQLRQLNREVGTNFAINETELQEAFERAQLQQVNDALAVDPEADDYESSYQSSYDDESFESSGD